MTHHIDSLRQAVLQKKKFPHFFNATARRLGLSNGGADLPEPTLRALGRLLDPESKKVTGAQ
jgi:hypothetical protein